MNSVFTCIFRSNEYSKISRTGGITISRAMEGEEMVQ